MDEQDQPSGEDERAREVSGVSTAPARHHGRPTAPWLRILLFAAGLLVGVLGVGLLNVTTPDFAAVHGGSASSGGGQPRSGPTTAPGAEARVNAACLAVLNDAQDVYAVLGDLGQALDDVDLTALDDIARRLQPVEPRLGSDLAGCRVDTSVGPGGAATPPAAPLTTPPPVGAPQPSPTR